MRQRILTILAALVSLCLFVKLSSPQLQNTRLAWINWGSLTGRNNFYFAKRQWLADARTIVAAVRYLCESSAATRINPMDVADVPRMEAKGRVQKVGTFLLQRWPQRTLLTPPGLWDSRPDLIATNLEGA
jgi:hypothetical protein